MQAFRVDTTPHEVSPLLDVVHEGGRWTLYLGTLRLFSYNSLIQALRASGRRVVEAPDAN